MMTARPYQITAAERIHAAWQEVNRTLLVLPTGCGKTIVFSVGVIIRLYTSGSRRMYYRDVEHTLNKRQDGGSDFHFDSGPLSMPVPYSIPCEFSLARETARKG